MTDQGSEVSRTSLPSTHRFALSAVAGSEPPPDPSQAVSLQLALTVGPPSEMNASHADTASTYQRTYASTSKPPSTLASYAPSAMTKVTPASRMTNVPSKVTYAPSAVPSTTLSKVASTHLSKVPSTTLSKVASTSLSKTTVGPCSTALSKVASAPSAAADAYRSPCGAAGRDAARCQRRIRDLIGKHETKNVELEKREGLLHRRLQMLECSMPAVMVWQAWRTQATPEAVHKLVAEAANGSNCKVTPSQHYDCRVREIEAQRKKACRRAEQAQRVWLEKEAALQGQEARLELARQQQEERRACIERLAAEARKLGAPCGEGPGRSKWPQVAESETSLHPEDLECLSRLESLAEAEACMKRQIAELEAKELAYMCALARAEELCSNAPPPGSASGVERSVGRSDTSLRPADKDAQAAPATQDSQAQNEPGHWQVDRPAGGSDCIATVRDQSTEAAAGSETKETSANVSTASKSVGKAPKCKSACVGRIHSVANKSVSTKVETRDKNVQSRSDVADKSEATIASSQYGGCGGKCAVCPCNVESRSGMMDTNKQKVETKSSKSATSIGRDKSCKMITVARADILTCYDMVNKILQNSELSKLPPISKDMGELKCIIERVLKTAVCYEEPAKSTSKQKVCGSRTSSRDRASGPSKKVSTSSLVYSQATVCLAERSPLRLLGSFQKSPDTKSSLKSKSSINLSERKSVGTQMSKRSQSSVRKTPSKVSIECATSICSRNQKPSASTSMSRSKTNIAAQTTPSVSRSRTILPSVASTRSKGPTSIKSAASKKTAPSILSSILGSKTAASATPSAVKSIRSASTKISKLGATQGSRPVVTKSKSLISAKPSASKTLTTVPSVTRSKVTLSRQPSKAKSVGSISVKSSKTNFGSLTSRSATKCSPPVSRSPSKCSRPKSPSAPTSAKSATVAPSEKSATIAPSAKSSVPTALPCLASRLTAASPISTMGIARAALSTLPCIAMSDTKADSPRTSTSRSKDSPRTSRGSASVVAPTSTKSKQSSTAERCASKPKCAKSTSGSTAKSKCALTAPSLKSSEPRSQRSASPERFEIKSASRVASATTLGTLDAVPSGQSHTVSSGTQAGQYLATQRSLASTAKTAAPSEVHSAASSTVQNAARSVVPSAAPSTVRPVQPSVVTSAAPSTVRPVQPSAAPTAAPSTIRSAVASTVPSAEPSKVHSTAAPSAVPSAVSKIIASEAPSSAHTKTPSSVPSAPPVSVHSKGTSAVPTMSSAGTCPLASRSRSKHSEVSKPSAVSSTKCPTAPPTASSACVKPSIKPSVHSSSAPSEVHSVAPCTPQQKSREIVTKSFDYTSKSKEEMAKPAEQPSKLSARSEMAKTAYDLASEIVLPEIHSKISIPTEASSSHRSVRSTCTPKEKSQKSLPKEQPSSTPSKTVSTKSISRSKSDTMLTQKASKTSSKREPESATPKESKASSKKEPEPLTTPQESKASSKREPESSTTLKGSKSTLPKESKVPLTSSKSERTITPKASKSTIPSTKTSKTSKTKSSPSICKTASAKSIPSKKSIKSGKGSKSCASRSTQRSKRSGEVKEPKIPETEVRSVDLEAQKSRPDAPEEAGGVHFTISMTKIDLLASVEAPRAIEAASRHSGESDYHECTCDLREIYPPAPRPTAVHADLLAKQDKQDQLVAVLEAAGMPQRAAATKLICGCSEELEQERRARARPLDKARPEPCPHYPRPARRWRRRHRALPPPRLCECVRLQPPTPAPSPPSRCHLCGGPLLPAAASPPSVCSSSGGDDGRPAERIISCRCEPAGSEVAVPPAKRDQGVLAKLPKPGDKKRKSEKPEERHTLEVLFERTTRKAEQFLASLRYGPPKLENGRCPASPRGSCTCPRNACDC